MPFERSIAIAASGLIGSALLGYGLYQKRRVSESMEWPESSATITEADVVHDSGPDSNGYAVRISYEYMADGVPYTGKRIGFRERWYVRKKRAEEELARYAGGAKLPVYYNPANPGDAVLMREAADGTLLIVLGAGLLALAVVALLWG